MQGILKNFGEYMESYRSGHNGAHSKCVCPPGRVRIPPTPLFQLRHAVIATWRIIVLKELHSNAKLLP